MQSSPKLFGRSPDNPDRRAPVKTVYNIVLGSTSSNATTTWADVAGSSVNHVFTRQRAMIWAHFGAVTSSGTQRAMGRICVGSAEGENESGVFGAAVERSVVLAEEFNVDFATDDPVAVKLQHKSETNGPSAQVLNAVKIMFVIEEYD